MPRIIKAREHDVDVEQVAFNFDDMAAEADKRVERIRKEAAALIAKAHEEAARIREEAETEGRRQGVEAVEQMVEKGIAQRMATLMPALEEVVADVRDAKQAWMSHWEQSAVQVAVAIARRVIRRELTRQPEITLDLIREALELAAGSSTLRVHVNTEDHKTLAPQMETLVQELSPLGDAHVVADAQIAPGGCRVETSFGTIDQQFEAQLARIEEELA